MSAGQSLLCKLGAGSVWITRPAATWGPAGDAYWGQPEDSNPEMAGVKGFRGRWVFKVARGPWKGWTLPLSRSRHLSKLFSRLLARTKAYFVQFLQPLNFFAHSHSLTLALFSCRFWLRYISKRRCGRQSLRNSFPRDKQQNGKWSVAVWIAAQEA